MDPKNGILMGIWVGTGHDSIADIAAASMAFALDDEAKRKTEQEEQLNNGSDPTKYPWEK